MTDKTITILDDEQQQEPANVEDQAPTAEPEQAPETPAEELDPQATIEKLMAVNAELSEQVKRTSAEFQNFSRRQEEEAKRVKVRIREDIIRSLLPILDHLDRTLAAAGQGGDGAFEALLKGVELIDKDVKKIFSDHGLKTISSEGEFDPALHQAVMMEETDEVEDQTILQELQKGYMLNDRVIRPSMVKVARNA